MYFLSKNTIVRRLTAVVLVQDKELKLIGSCIYNWNDYYKAIDLVKKDKVNLKILQTHHLNFERFPDAYRLCDEKPDEVMKILIDLD